MYTPVSIASGTVVTDAGDHDEAIIFSVGPVKLVIDVGSVTSLATSSVWVHNLLTTSWWASVLNHLSIDGDGVHRAITEDAAVPGYGQKHDR